MLYSKDKANDSNFLDDIPKRYLIQVKRGIAWSYRELELTNEMISYYKQENNELRFQGFIRDFELIQSKKNLLTLMPKNKQNSIEVKIWSEDADQLKRIKHTFDDLLSKVSKNVNEGRKGIILDSSEDSRESNQESGLLPDNTEPILKSKQQSRTSSLIADKKSSLLLNDSFHIKQMQIDLSEPKAPNDEDNKEEDNVKVSHEFNSKEFTHNNLQHHFDLSYEKSEVYHNICYTKHSIIDINSDSEDLTFLMLMNDGFIDSINALKLEALQLSKEKESIYNGTHIILLLSLVIIILSLSYFIYNPFISSLVACGIGGFAYVLFTKCLNRQKRPSLSLKDPQFDYNFIQNDKRIIRISTFFNERLAVLMKRLVNEEGIIDRSYSYLITRKEDGSLIYLSSLFDSNETCELKLKKESNYKEDTWESKEIIIIEYIEDDMVRTTCFEEKEVEENCFMTKATIYLRIGSLFNQRIPVTFLKDTLTSFDKLHQLLLKDNFN